MNNFTQMLDLIVTADHTQPLDWVTRWTYVGRVAIGSLSNGLLCRLEFVTTGVQNQYDAVKVQIISKASGEVNSITLRFTDLWEPREARAGVGMRVINHLFIDGGPLKGSLKWYIEKPYQHELEVLRDEIVAYATMFS